MVVAVTIVEHTHGVGGGAVGLALGVVHVAAQVGACLAVIAQMVVTLTHQTVQLGVEIVVAVFLEQGFTLVDHIAIAHTLVVHVLFQNLTSICNIATLTYYLILAAIRMFRQNKFMELLLIVLL